MTPDPGISEWGNPMEEKTTVIPQVVASERGGAQTAWFTDHAGL